MAGNSYVRSLDGVRALAIILVMAFHAGLASFGWIGVQFFFVLSGYLITNILWSEKFKSGQNIATKLKKFWVRRSLRIFPLYYAYIFVIGISYLVFQFPPYFPAYFPYIVSYTANFPLLEFERLGNPLFNHLWSLSIEEQFYLLFPLLMLFCSARAIKRIFLVVILLSPVVRFAVGEYYRNQGLSELTISNGVNFNTLCQLDAFFIGGIITVMSLDKKISRPFSLFVCLLLLTITAGLTSYLTSESEYSYLKDLGFNHYLIGNYQHVWHYTLLNFLFASFVLCLVSPLRMQAVAPLKKLMENAVLVRIGRVSYGMYLFHWLIWVYVFGKIFHPQSDAYKALLFIPYVAAVYLASEISFNLFEIHFIRMKDRFFPSLKPVSVVTLTGKEELSS